MNPLSQYPSVRRYLYLGMWVVGLILTAAQIGVAAIPDAQQPGWLTVALAVFPAVATYVGYTAQQNTRQSLVARHGIARHDTYSGDSKTDATFHDGTQP